MPQPASANRLDSDTTHVTRQSGRVASGRAGLRDVGSQKKAKPQAALERSDVEKAYFRVVSLTLMACWKYLSAWSLSPSWRCMVARLL